jgi:acetyl esterase/lipase
MLKISSILWSGAVGAVAALVLFGALAINPGLAVNSLSALGDYSINSNIPYEQETSRTLDVYRPSGTRTSLPVVIFFHGGSWSSGSKADYKFLGAALASRGILTVVPNYRLSPVSLFPAFLQDSALAVRWTIDNAARFGGDPHRLILMGHSAGAYIAAMLVFDQQWLSAVGLDAQHDVAGWVGLSGPYDLASVDARLPEQVFDTVHDKASIQPINFVDGKGPPAFLAAGSNDSVVSPRSTLKLANRILAAGGRAEATIYPRLGHSMLIATFSPIFEILAPVPFDVAKFVVDQTHLLRENEFSSGLMITK